nr:MAG: polyprotein [Botrytis cinerea hypovirus 1]
MPGTTYFHTASLLTGRTKMILHETKLAKRKRSANVRGRQNSKHKAARPTTRSVVSNGVGKKGEVRDWITGELYLDWDGTRKPASPVACVEEPAVPEYDRVTRLYLATLVECTDFCTGEKFMGPPVPEPEPVVREVRKTRKPPVFVESFVDMDGGFYAPLSFVKEDEYAGPGWDGFAAPSRKRGFNCQKNFSAVRWQQKCLEKKMWQLKCKVARAIGQPIQRVAEYFGRKSLPNNQVALERVLSAQGLLGMVSGERFLYWIHQLKRLWACPKKGYILHWFEGFSSLILDKKQSGIEVLYNNIAICHLGLGDTLRDMLGEGTSAAVGPEFDDEYEVFDNHGGTQFAPLPPPGGFNAVYNDSDDEDNFLSGPPIEGGSLVGSLVDSLKSSMIRDEVDFPVGEPILRMTAFDTVKDFQKEYDATLSGPLCWKGLFPAWDDLGYMMLCNLSSLIGARAFIPHDDWDHIEFSRHGDKYHVANATMGRTTEEQWDVAALNEHIFDICFNDPTQLCKFVELTTAVVMGTIGDLEPTLDTVATNYFASQMDQIEVVVPTETQYTFQETGAGWTATDFFKKQCDGFAKDFSDKHGSAKGTLSVSPELWNRICHVWGGQKVYFEGGTMPGSFVVELTDDTEYLKVPDREAGPHARVMPSDFVLVTHPDHIEKMAPEIKAGNWETVALPMDSKKFIALGQSILEKGIWAAQDMKAMHNTLYEHIKVAMPKCEMSDLIYLVSGTTFYYFMASVFPDKQVFEVCPVPREDNGVCPEFYLAHYFEDLSLDPHVGFAIGRMYSKWLTAPKYLNGLEWEGTYQYREPPKYHSISPWAADRWKISSPNIGFKPYDDFVRKKDFIEKPIILGYFSLGSCESITPETKTAINWLKSLPVLWEVDKRWTHLFEGSEYVISPFTNHSTYLCKFDWVVHHGGSGVTNTCLAVGVPQTILPQIGDQFIWRRELVNHMVPLHIDTSVLRALLFLQRSPAEPVEGWCDQIINGPSFWLPALQANNATPVKPFHLSFNCCHDWSAYGWGAPPVHIIGENEEWWFGLYNSTWETNEVNIELKFVRKICTTQCKSTVVGWTGFTLTQTYPDHAHGWITSPELMNDSRHVKALNAKYISANSEETLKAYSEQALTSRSKFNKYMFVKPNNAPCACGGYGYDMGGKCERCVLATLEGGVYDVRSLDGFVKTLYGGLPRRKKPASKDITFRKAPSTFAVQSRKRYYQLDSRCIPTAKSPAVARALLDQISSLEDVANVEAFWKYTLTKPPHYHYKSNSGFLKHKIEEQERKHLDVTLSGMGTEVMFALGGVLSVGAPKDLAHRLFNRHVLTSSGRSFLFRRWWVLVDALRHFDEFVRELGMKAMYDVVRDFFPPIPEVEFKSVLPYSFALHHPLRTRAAGKLWMQTLPNTDARLRVHLFSLRAHGLGNAFGLFHAVIEHEGNYWELQQIAGERCHINVSKFPPEPTADRPLVKTIIVSSQIVGSLDRRAICREFDNLQYKVLGDNCLVFANMLVFLLTGKVIPWKHFGAFGTDISLDAFKLLGKWASSWVFLSEGEERLQIRDNRSACLTYDGPIVHSLKSWTGPKRFTKDYGIHAVQRIEACLEAFSDDPDVECPQERDHLLQFMSFATSKFGVTGATVARAIMTRRVRKIPTSGRQWKFLHHLAVLFRQARDTRLGGDVIGLMTATVNLRGSMRNGKKVSWTPLVNVSVPRHWFRSGDRLVEVNHLPENLKMQKKTITRLDLPQIARKYAQFFPDAEFPKMGFKFVKPGEYEIGVKVNIRKDLPKMDVLTHSLVKELQEINPFEIGVFSLRFGTVEMAEKVTDRYFTGSFDPGQLIPEADQEEIAEAIFQNEKHLFGDTQLISPEEVWKKWHRNYSAGFPFRFNAQGRASRQTLIDQVGGKEKFLKCVRDYIESPEAFPTVSHAFIKDEVLPKSYIEREKIRTIIAQDPLNYYLSMAIQGDSAKRLDPSSFSAVGISPSHGQMAALASKHLAYEHHTAMDVTAMDSTAAVDAIGVIKKLRKKGFKDHPQREAIETAVDATYDNLVASWIIDIHTGRARLKRQGLSTGHATTTPSNTEYMRVLMLYAWKKVTDRPYSEFYDCVKFSSFSDDNFWSTNLPPSVFSGEKVSEFWLKNKVQVRVEGCSDNLADISFLSKKFSLDEKHLEEVRTITGAHAKVAIVHDMSRLLQKFSDFKKKNTLRYRWEKYAALQLNCAHYPEIHATVDKYLDTMEKMLLKRKSGKRFLQQHPRTSYHDVMRLMYLPTDKTRRDLIVSTHEPGLFEKIEDWWDTTRSHIMTFDSTANTYGRILSQVAGLLEIGGLNIEDPGLFLTGPGELYHDPEYTLEHHLYLLNNCPESYEKMQILASKTPFSGFMDIAGFWARREVYDLSEEMANSLRVKVTLLLAVYTLVAWLEQALMSVPVVGPLYRLFGTAKYMSEKVYSRLNSLYYAVFGDSSAVISSLMPKDRYYSLKVVAHRLWCTMTPLDFGGLKGGIHGAQAWADALIKFTQDIHQIVLDGDLSALLPAPGTGERAQSGVNTNWVGLDHADSVDKVQTLLSEGKIPMITSPPGAGKSTDFILSLKQVYDTVIVACPRQILVQNNPVAQTRLYAGCEDTLTQGLINFGTAGYLRRVLADLPQNTIICLDEFHEMDEDALWLLDRYHEQSFPITATPDFYGANKFTEVRLSKGRNSRWTITDDIRKGSNTLDVGWETLMTFSKTNDRVLFIMPTVANVETCMRHAEQLVTNKRCAKIYRGHSTVVEADWYFATAIVDAGITIPNVNVVIDLGVSMGYHKGKFKPRPSSRNISLQRRGRTGRTCNGTYIRLSEKYDDTNWDFSTPFLCNSWYTARKWDPTFTRGLCRKDGCLDGLPGGYEDFLANADWSPLIYAIFMYENRLDVNKARASYQALRKFPERKEFRHLTAQREGYAFDDLFVVEDKLRRHKLGDGLANFWTWNLSETKFIDFDTPIPSHLLDAE